MSQEASHRASAVVLRDDKFQIASFDVGGVDPQSLGQPIKDQNLIGVLRLDRINFCNGISEIKLFFAEEF